MLSNFCMIESITSIGRIYISIVHLARQETDADTIRPDGHGWINGKIISNTNLPIDSHLFCLLFLGTVDAIMYSIISTIFSLN